VKKKEGLKELRIVDNFYQTSGFFPMPTVVVGTVSDSGRTNLGPYSLCFPYYVAGKGYYAMVLETRNTSNTCRNILRTGKASINFIPARKRFMKQIVELGYPGDSTDEKMKNCIFTLVDGVSRRDDPDGVYPKVVAESFQVYECTWMRDLDNASRDEARETYDPPYHDFNGITSETGAHFILRIDHVLAAGKQYDAVINGTRADNFPAVPVDYGYRDNTRFWIAPFKRPVSFPIPRRQAVDTDTVWFAANRIDPKVQFTKEACKKLAGVPRVFLNTALKGCVEWARKNGVSLVTEKEMEMIRDKRSVEKSVVDR